MWYKCLSGLLTIAFIAIGVLMLDQELVRALVRDGYIGAAVYAARPSIVCAFGALASMFFLVWLSRKRIVAVSISVWVSVAGFVVGMKKWPSACWGYFKQIPGKVKKWPSACREYVKQIPGKVKRWPGMFWRWLKNFFSVHFVANWKIAVLLGAIPLAFMVWSYFDTSAERKAENARDKLMPTVTEMYEQVKPYVLEPDKRTGEAQFWTDTKSSLKLLAYGVSISAMMALVLGIFMGVFPWFRALSMPVVIVLSIIPPLSILAILFCVFGTGDMTKIVLIIIGICFIMIRDIVSYIRAIPIEQMVKTLTLGRGQLYFMTRIVTPQVLPRFIEILRINLGPAWIFLIASEAISASAGLSYRIYLAQRTINMALIIPIVFWITFLAVVMNYALLFLNKKCFKWYWLGGK